MLLVITVLALPLLSSCRVVDTSSTTPTSTIDPAVVSAAQREQALLMAASRLAGMQDAARVLTVHVEALFAATGSSPPAGSAPQSSATASPGGRESFARAVQRASNAALRSTAGASNGQAAALLASVAASDAALSVWIRTAVRTGSSDSASLTWEAAFASWSAPRPDDTATSAPPTAELEAAWQASSAIEDAAVFGFGLVGGRLGASNQAAQWSLGLHTAYRNQLRAALSGVDATASAPAPAYTPPSPVTTTRDAMRLATSIELRSQPSYAGLVMAGTTPWRWTAARWLRTSSLAELAWTGRVEALPGLQS